MLHCDFVPADDVAARRLLQVEETLVVIWDVRDDPEVGSSFVSCALGVGFSLELPEGEYHLAAFVFDEFRDHVRGIASAEHVWLPGNQEWSLTLHVEVTETERLTDELFGESGAAIAELVLPDGVSLPIYGATLIGRSPDCNLQLDDPTVSRRHAEIRVTDQGCWLEDLGSANGSFVNGVPIASTPLDHGDVVGIGAIDVGFRAR
jgi:hypothetical protein